MRVILLFVLLSLTSCWETLPDGRKYRLNKHCLKSHESEYTTVEYDAALDIPKMVTKTETICDSGYFDTIWKK